MKWKKFSSSQGLNRIQNPQTFTKYDDNRVDIIEDCSEIARLVFLIEK